MGKDISFISKKALENVIIPNYLETSDKKIQTENHVDVIEIEQVLDVEPPKPELSVCAELTDICCGENIQGVSRCCCCLAGSASELWDKRHQISSCRHCIRGLFTVEHLKNTFPIMKWLPKYRLPELQGDVIAGITAALTVLPQSLAFAKIASLPPEYGLYSAFISCFVYMFLGTAKDVSLGPAAVMSLLTARFAQSPVEGDPTYAIVLALACGIVQFMLGILNLGFVVDFISLPVLHAFTSASVITIFFGQIPNWLGLRKIPRDFLQQVYWVFKRLPETNIGDLWLGLVCMVLLFLMKKMQKIRCSRGKEQSPSCGLRIVRYIVWLLSTARNAVVVVSAAGAMAICNHYDVRTFNFTLTGHVPEGLPPFRPPAFTVIDGNTTIAATEIFKGIGVGFFIIPVLGLVQAVAVGKTFGRINKYKVDPNQELLANGVANILGSFVGAYPIAASISRSSVYSQSGAKTPFGGFYTGAVVMIALAFLTPLFYYIPTSTLAAIIIMAVIDMGDTSLIVDMWRIKKIDFIPWLVTFVLSFIIGVEYGLLVGMGVSILFLLFPAARPSIRSKRIPGVVLQPKQGLQFPSTEYFKDVVLNSIHADTVDAYKTVVLDFGHVSTVDYTVVQGIKQCIEDYWAKNVQLIFCNIRPGVLETLSQMKLAHFKYTANTEEAFNAIKVDETTRNGSSEADVSTAETDSHNENMSEIWTSDEAKIMQRSNPADIPKVDESKSGGIDNFSYNF